MLCDLRCPVHEPLETEPNVMHHASLRDLDFVTVPRTCYSTAGLPYIRWARVGMPKIPQAVINSVFFLFADEETARSGADPGGTGFHSLCSFHKGPNWT
jgi:hypothetical protein